MLKVISLQSLRDSGGFAGMVELVDTLDLGSSAARRGGSTPFTRTTKKGAFAPFFYF